MQFKTVKRWFVSVINSCPHLYLPVSKGTTNKQGIFIIVQKNGSQLTLMSSGPVQVCRTHQISLFTKVFPGEDAAIGWQTKGRTVWIVFLCQQPPVWQDGRLCTCRCFLRTFVSLFASLTLSQIHPLVHKWQPMNAPHCSPIKLSCRVPEHISR